MESILQLKSVERAQLFQEASNRSGIVSPTIIERIFGLHGCLIKRLKLLNKNSIYHWLLKVARACQKCMTSLRDFQKISI